MQHVGLLPLLESNPQNRKKCLGRPLFCWVLTQAIFSKLDKIAIATDSDWVITFIKTHYTWTDKIDFVSLPQNTNNADYRETALHFLKHTQTPYTTLSLLFAANPFVQSGDINRCVEAINDNQSTSKTVVNLNRKIYDSESSMLTNDDDLFVENSGVISTNISSFLAEKDFDNNCALITMPKESLNANDENLNWSLVEQQLAQSLISQKQCKRINYVVLDVDGVFTDGGIYYDSDGEMAKRFDMRDGMGLEILREHDVDVIIMTSENSELVKKRMQKLKINYVFLGAKDKYSLLEHFIRKNNLDRSEIAYVGDDVNDLANLCSVGWSFAPKNATNNVLPLVDVVLSKPSGNGAIREVCEFVLKYNRRSHNA